MRTTLSLQSPFVCTDSTTFKHDKSVFQHWWEPAWDHQAVNVWGGRWSKSCKEWALSGRPWCSHRCRAVKLLKQKASSHAQVVLSASFRSCVETGRISSRRRPSSCARCRAWRLLLLGRTCPLWKPWWPSSTTWAPSILYMRWIFLDARTKDIVDDSLRSKYLPACVWLTYVRYVLLARVLVKDEDLFHPHERVSTEH